MKNTLTENDFLELSEDDFMRIAAARIANEKLSTKFNSREIVLRITDNDMVEMKISSDLVPRDISYLSDVLKASIIGKISVTFRDIPVAPTLKVVQNENSDLVN